jgi:hypothetical protein
VNELNLDAGLEEVLDAARKKSVPVRRALAESRPLASADLTSAAVELVALIGAIDARLPKTKTLKAAA